MLLSKSCMYAIRAALLVSAQTKKGEVAYSPIKQISDDLDVSFYFLTKILQVLTHADIMESYKGPNGGVRLARPAKAVCLMDIVRAVDGPDVFNGCILGLPGCDDSDPCPLHQKCTKAMAQLEKMFEKTTLAALTKEAERLLYRL